MRPPSCALRRTLCALGVLLAACPAGARERVRQTGSAIISEDPRPQEPHQHAPAAPQDAPAWQWNWDANVVIGWNYQYRKFRDFQVVESQNWLMGTGERAMGDGRLRLSGMLSLEPLTIQDLGSPQVFQTGETFQGAPLIDYVT